MTLTINVCSLEAIVSDIYSVTRYVPTFAHFFGLNVRISFAIVKKSAMPEGFEKTEKVTGEPSGSA